MKRGDGRPDRVRRVTEKDAQRAAVGRQLINIGQGQAVLREELLHHAERELREVLVINCIELVVLDQAQEVREPERRDPIRREKDSEAFGKIMQLRHVREHVVRHHQVRRATSIA